MTNYNPANLNGSPMPLLMGFTQPTPIREGSDIPKIYYDPKTQTIVLAMGFWKNLFEQRREVGTECLRNTGRTQTSVDIHGKKYYQNCDPKNEIDDSKFEPV